MAVHVYRGKSDGKVKQIIGALRRYQETHPEAEIDVYRQNSVSIRIRVIDPDFSGVSRSQRHDHVWNCLQTLPDATVEDISTVLLLSPDERRESFANLDFENPVPSKL